MAANNKSSSKGKQISKNDSFLEAFRDLGSDLASNLTGGFNNKPLSENNNSDRLLFQKEADLEYKYRSQVRKLENIHREEKILFSQKERVTQNQVESLKNEIKGLAKATGDLAKEAEIAAIQEAPFAGTYHVNFFERLSRIIKNLRSQVQESSMWLASWNKKASKRNSYWGQFKKSGSKFMLSADRYMSTQAG
jgi:hypothetical protein